MSLQCQNFVNKSSIEAVGFREFTEKPDRFFVSLERKLMM